MANDIFRLDWIFIDSIIIILLLLLLICVKIFKERSRWRSSLSNESLEIFTPNKSDINLKSLHITVKNWSFIRNIAFKGVETSKPIIFIIRTNKTRKLLYTLTEGLTSYGFNVIILNLKIRAYQKYNSLENPIQEEIRSIISTLLNLFEQNKSILNSNYILINYLESEIFFNSILSDTKNFGMILLNPKISSINIACIYDKLNQTNLKSPICVIFSKKSKIIMKNKNLKRFLKIFPLENNNHLRFLTLEKARKSFKHYETILLGIIVNLIEKISLKSQFLS